MNRNKKSILPENIGFEILKQLKIISEADMKDVAGERQIAEDSSIEQNLKSTVLEMAQNLNKEQFFEKIQELGLPRSSVLVKAVEPLLKK